MNSLLKLHEIEIPIRKVRWPKFLSEPNPNLTNKCYVPNNCPEGYLYNFKNFQKNIEVKKSLWILIYVNKNQLKIQLNWPEATIAEKTIPLFIFFQKNKIINVNRTFIRKIWVKTYHASYRSLRSVIICQNFLVGHMVC